MSALCFIFMLLIVITIPALTYAFFFLLKCPPNPLLPSSSAQSPSLAAVTVDSSGKAGGPRMERVTIVVAKMDNTKEEARGDGFDDCPVCLATFKDGEELWQINLCKHLFHGSCIERWLHTHSNCPVCRAYVMFPKPPAPSKRSLVVPTAARVTGTTREDDLWQGLPGSAGLV